MWARPTLDCNGIFGGFTGKGAKTIIPSMATSKISMRLVPDQDPRRIIKEFTKYIKKIAPKSVNVIVHDLHSAYPVLPLSAIKLLSLLPEQWKLPLAKKQFMSAMAAQYLS